MVGLRRPQERRPRCPGVFELELGSNVNAACGFGVSVSCDLVPCISCQLDVRSGPSGIASLHAAKR